MLDLTERFILPVQAYFGPVNDPVAKCYCSLWDWDQLRSMIKVKGTIKFFPLKDDTDTSICVQYFNYLAPNVHITTIDNTGISTDLGDDETSFVAYPPLSLCKQLVSYPTFRD